MAHLKALIQNQIVSLRKEITRKTAELSALEIELKTALKIAEILGNGTKQYKARKTVTDWDSVLKALPSQFSVGEITKVSQVKTKSKVYLYQIIAKWNKAGMIKNLAKGRYKKGLWTKTKNR